MEIKDWRQYKKVLSQKMQDDSAFTLIELIVVMAIIAILVLLAAPQFLGYTSKAKDAQIANDIAVVEMVTTEKLIDHKWADKNYDDEWSNVDDDGVKIDRDYIYDNFIDPDREDKDNKIHDKGGVIEVTPEDVDDEEFDKDKILPDGDYRVVPKDFIDDNTGSDLDGTYIANKDGEVFFIPDVEIIGSNDSSSTEGNGEQSPVEPGDGSGDEPGNGDNDDTGGENGDESGNGDNNDTGDGSNQGGEGTGDEQENEVVELELLSIESVEAEYYLNEDAEFIVKIQSDSDIHYISMYFYDQWMMHGDMSFNDYTVLDVTDDVYTLRVSGFIPGGAGGIFEFQNLDVTNANGESVTVYSWDIPQHVTIYVHGNLRP